MLLPKDKNGPKISCNPNAAMAICFKKVHYCPIALDSCYLRCRECGSRRLIKCKKCDAPLYIKCFKKHHKN